MAIDADAVPIEPGARTWFERHQQDPRMAALDSDDYELLFTVRPRLRGRLSAAMQHGGVPLTRIGVCTPDHGIALRTSDGRELTALPHGFSHFR
jgi:thiamine monophosphate kinase